jgi:hypothetical protein
LAAGAVYIISYMNFILLPLPFLRFCKAHKTKGCLKKKKASSFNAVFFFQKQTVLLRSSISALFPSTKSLHSLPLVGAGLRFSFRKANSASLPFFALGEEGEEQPTCAKRGRES